MNSIKKYDADVAQEEVAADMATSITSSSLDTSKVKTDIFLLKLGFELAGVYITFEMQQKNIYTCELIQYIFIHSENSK